MIESDANVPELNDVILNEETLHSLFSDLAACATVHRVQVRMGNRNAADHATASLDDALSLLISGEARGVQVRYNWQEQSYCDTVLRIDDGYRLVRILEEGTRH